MKVIIKDIDWNTDDEKVKLPKSVTVKDINGIVDLDEALSDWLTNTYGFCHSGFEYEVIGDRQECQKQFLKREIDRLHKENAAYSRIADFLYEHKECFADEQQKEIDEMFAAL